MQFGGWKTRVSRIGRIDIPRYHQALAYVRDFALQNAVQDVLQASQLLEDQFEFTEDGLDEASDFIGEQAREWLSSAIREGDIPPPLEDAIQRGPSGGGMTVIYVATFGNEPLAAPRLD